MNWFVSLQVPPRPLSCIQDPFHPLLRLVVAYCPFTNPYCIPRCLCVLSYLVPWHFIPLFGFCLLVWLISVDVSVYGICFCCIRFPPPSLHYCFRVILLISVHCSMQLLHPSTCGSDVIIPQHFTLRHRLSHSRSVFHFGKMIDLNTRLFYRELCLSAQPGCKANGRRRPR